MARLSDNYYQRECYIASDTVPTQSVMINKMSPPLARVYFKSMNKKLKTLAGLEPPMKGGGNDWFIPPAEVLAGRLVMQPVANESLKKLGFNGIVDFGEYFTALKHKRMVQEIDQVLHESDENWKKKIAVTRCQQWENSSKAAASANTAKLQKAFQEFTMMYSTSITNIENLLLDAAIKEIETVRDQTFEKMSALYKESLKDQATMLYDRYETKLFEEKQKQKSNFVNHVEQLRTETGSRIHDVKLEKHIVVEKLRQLQESLNLACQVYVALKEREACQKEMELSKHKQRKKIKAVKEEIALKEFEIQLAMEKEKKCEEVNTIWKKKVCEVVKKFQMFASYCLQELPEHGDFFIDMEKLMMLQLSDVVKSPDAGSLFEVEEPVFHTPVPRPHPFYMFCDKGFKPQVNKELCPEHCTSSASLLPVVVVNKRFIYAACDNFQQYTDKVTEYIRGRRGEDADFEDTHLYEFGVPVQITSSDQLLELKLQSSIMQVLQNELSNARKVPIECCMCKIPHCFCSPSPSRGWVYDMPHVESEKIPPVKAPAKTIKSRKVELLHARQPKWESYMAFVRPTRCTCGKLAKGHLQEHLPAYMRMTSKFQELSLPNYERCSLERLKKLVKRAQGYVPPAPRAGAAPPRAREVGTQYSDQEFDFLCTCFSDEEVAKLLKQLVRSAGGAQFAVVGAGAGTGRGDAAGAGAARGDAAELSAECARDLRRLLHGEPQLLEIFKRQHFDYE